MLSKQKKLFKTGDVDKWEIALLVRVLTTFDLSTPSTSKLIDEQNSKIQKLTQIRNYVAHNAKHQVIPTDFQQFCGEIEDALLSIGESKEFIDRLKHGMQILSICTYFFSSTII